jgi:hypothetical protein
VIPLAARIAPLAERRNRVGQAGAVLRSLEATDAALDYIRAYRPPATLDLVPPPISTAALKLLVARVAAAVALSANGKADPTALLGDDEHARVLYRAMAKGAQPPAMTTDPDWGATLVQWALAAWHDSLASVSVAASLARSGVQLQFGDRLARRKRSATPDLSGAFRAEGAPIRVSSSGTVATKLLPYSMGCIWTATESVLRNTGAAQIFNELMLDDTARMLDAAMLGTDPAVPGVAPAGLAHGIVPLQGGKPDTDLPGAIGDAIKAMGAANLDMRRARWVMSPAMMESLASVVGGQFGTVIYPELAAPGGGTKPLYRIPVMLSSSMPLDRILLINLDGIVARVDAPSLAATSEATVHEEDTTPLPIVDDAGVSAAPARSLFQTVTSAVRSVQQVGYERLDDAAVKLITGIDWT